MKNLRIYGEAPYFVAVIHGGPGAPGTLKPVAEALMNEFGVLEPFQTAGTIDGQVEELSGLLNQHADLPITLVGHSWGAWLSYITAVRYPELVKKLILVSSGPFEASYVSQIAVTRESRLSHEENKRVDALLKMLGDPGIQERKAVLAEFGRLMGKADAYDPLPAEDNLIDLKADAFDGLMKEAMALRAGGELLRIGSQMGCPVLAIHGDYDPHPWQGVKEPLMRVVQDFQFVLLERCGHTPWYERQAREAFFQILREALN